MDSRYCPECRDERAFECPPCVDGHDDCPERFCATCGYAMVVESLELYALTTPEPAHHAAA